MTATDRTREADPEAWSTWSRLSGRAVDGSFGGASYRTGSFTLTTNRQYYWPFRVVEAFTPTYAGINVTTAPLSGNCKIGLYFPLRSNMLPGARIYNGGAIDVSSTGEKLQSWTGGRLDPGWYWIGLVADNSGISLQRVIRSYMGKALPFDAISSSNPPAYGYNDSGGYSGAWADPAPTSWTWDTGLYVPLVALEP